MDSRADWFMVRNLEGDSVELTKELNRILDELSRAIQLAEIWAKI